MSFVRFGGLSSRVLYDIRTVQPDPEHGLEGRVTFQLPNPQASGIFSAATKSIDFYCVCNDKPQNPLSEMRFTRLDQLSTGLGSAYVKLALDSNMTIYIEKPQQSDDDARIREARNLLYRLASLSQISTDLNAWCDQAAERSEKNARLALASTIIDDYYQQVFEDHENILTNPLKLL